MARVLWPCTWTAFTILLPVVLNFNVDDNNEAVEYFQLANSENISDKNDTTGYPFYGIDMRINENATLLVATLTGNEAKNVSVPAMNTKSAEDARTNSEQRAFDIRRIKTVNGRLVRCKQNGTKKCDHWLGNKISITGLALESTHGTLMTCSPPTALDCKYTYIYSGTCWKSNDMGLTWTSLKDIKPKCPTHTPKVDMMFVLDGSGSVSRSNFKTVLDWTKRVAEKFKIEDGTDRIGVVQYSSYDSSYDLNNQPQIKTEIRLGQYQNRDAFESAIDGIEQFRSGTHTARALEKTKLDFQASPRWHDTNTSKVLVLVTDGQ